MKSFQFFLFERAVVKRRLGYVKMRKMAQDTRIKQTLGLSSILFRPRFIFFRSISTAK